MLVSVIDLGLFDDTVSSGMVSVIDDLGSIWKEQSWSLVLRVVAVSSHLLIVTDSPFYHISVDEVSNRTNTL